MSAVAAGSGKVGERLAASLREIRVALVPIRAISAYEKNARTHSEEQIAQICGAVQEYGWTNPVLIDEDRVLIAGHARLEAALRLGLAEVPAITLAGLSQEQRRAYVIADNQLALNSGWDQSRLIAELTDLGTAGFDLNLVGFSETELARLLDGEPEGKQDDGSYTRKTVLPIYEPKGDRPEIGALVDTARTEALIAKIEASGASAEEKAFLIRAAQRHAVFDYHSIAEYYCHASPEVQGLMEDSALVLIDLDRAIEDGYVEMSKKLEGIYSASYGSDNSDDGEDDDDEAQ